MSYPLFVILVLVGIITVLTVGVLAVCYSLKYAYWNSKLNLQKLSQEKIKKLMYQYALNSAQAEYDSEGKPAYTKKGEMRVAFQRVVTNKYHDLCGKLLSGTGFKSSFIEYTNKVFPELAKKEFNIAVAKYLQKLTADEMNIRDRMLKGENFVTPEQFAAIRKKAEKDTVGVYVIYNQTKDKYYVGQAKRLIFRVNQHFTGHGNGDVYADYVYGDSFLIQLIPLIDSGYVDIDEMEREMIKKYDAYKSGYNRTVGNH